MPDLLFVYGTLRDPDLLAGILARPAPVARLPATAPGFRAVHYPDRIYPALVRAPGAIAEGLVLPDLSAFERDLLDAYEGDEYRRSAIAVMIDEELHEALAYLPAIAIAPEAEPWTLAAWQQAYKPRILAAEHAAADELRLKLIAIRPH
jgi:gamma-glutamylcyclotransferase (GGCT)/AIG2-like uncharacterized protein YtfP